MSELIDYAKNQLPSQFQDKENWNKYIEGTIATPEALNTKSKSMILFDLENCTGIELDIIGDILGSQRESRNDDDYRIELKLYSKLNNAQGNPNNIIFAFKSLISSNQMFYTEGFDDEIVLYVNFKEIPDSAVFDVIKRCIPAGMKLKIYYTENIEIFYSAMQTYQLFGNGEQITGNDNDIVGSFGLNSDQKRFTQPIFGNGEIIYGNGQPIVANFFDNMTL